jgi:cytochrome c2
MHDPRSYDAGRFATVENPFVATRAPQEWLKMPKFPLNEEQIEAIATAVNGMTAEPVGPDEVRQLTAQETDIERGRWMVKELNCYGCHLIEGRGWGIRTAGVTVETLRRHSASWSDWAKESVVTPGMEPPMLSGALPTQLRQGARTQPDWLFSFLKAPPTGLVRPWLKARMPTFDLTDAEANVLVRYFAAEAREEFPYKTAHAEPSPEMLAAGKQFFDNLQCFKCHIVEGRAFGKPLAEIPAAQLPQLAPDLRLARARLQRDWLIEQWLPNPGAQVPGTRMPVFEYGASLKESAPPLLGDDRQKQIEALVDYILSLGAQPAQPAPAPEAKATPAAVK